MANKPATQDHKPKAVKAKETTGQFRLSPEYELRDLEGWETTFEGLELFVPKESMNDYMVLENIAKMRDEGDTSMWRYPLVLERIFGVEQKNKLISHLTDKKTGRPDQKKLGEAINHVFTVANPNS